ncbi:MAG: hypothetical protein AAGF31_07235 [Planctomycetota bacterium]
MNLASLLLARSDGIAVTLTPLSKLIVGGLFLAILAAVLCVVFYRKPDGAAYPEEDAHSDSAAHKPGS